MYTIKSKETIKKFFFLTVQISGFFFSFSLIYVTYFSAPQNEIIHMWKG